MNLTSSNNFTLYLPDFRYTHVLPTFINTLETFHVKQISIGDFRNIEMFISYKSLFKKEKKKKKENFNHAECILILTRFSKCNSNAKILYFYD